MKLHNANSCSSGQICEETLGNTGLPVCRISLFVLGRRSSRRGVTLRRGRPQTPPDPPPPVAQVEGEFQKLGRKVHCIVNYSGFDCRSELQAPYEAVLARLQARHYLSIKRFSGRAFTRHKIGHSIGLREGELFTLEELQRIVSQRRGLTVNPGDVESLFRRHKNDVGLLPRDRLKLILELLV